MFRKIVIVYIIAVTVAITSILTGLFFSKTEKNDKVLNDKALNKPDKNTLIYSDSLPLKKTYKVDKQNKQKMVSTEVIVNPIHPNSGQVSEEKTGKKKDIDKQLEKDLEEIEDWLNSLSPVLKRQYLKCFEKGWFKPEDVPITYSKPGDYAPQGVYIYTTYSIGSDNPLPMTEEVEKENRRLSKEHAAALKNGEYERADAIMEQLTTLMKPYSRKNPGYDMLTMEIPGDWDPYFESKFEEYCKEQDRLRRNEMGP